MATSKSINVNPIRECDGKIDKGVGIEITLISPPGHKDIYTPGAPNRFLRSGVDLTDVTLVYKDANIIDI